MFGRAPLTSSSTLASSTGEYWKVDALDEKALRGKVANIEEAHQGLHKVVKERVKKNRERQRQAANRGQLPNFAVEDYVMVARVRLPGSTPKLVSTWIDPWRIVTADKVHVYGVQNIVSDEVRDVHVVRLRLYADKDLKMAEDGQSFDVKVDWVRFDEGESLWEPLTTIWDGAPQFIKSELRKLRLDRGVRSRLQKLYGITLKLITSLSSSFGLVFGNNGALGVL